VTSHGLSPPGTRLTYTRGWLQPCWFVARTSTSSYADASAIAVAHFRSSSHDGTSSLQHHTTQSPPSGFTTLCARGLHARAIVPDGLVVRAEGEGEHLGGAGAAIGEPSVLSHGRTCQSEHMRRAKLLCEQRFLVCEMKPDQGCQGTHLHASRLLRTSCTEQLRNSMHGAVCITSASLTPTPTKYVRVPGVPGATVTYVFRSFFLWYAYSHPCQAAAGVNTQLGSTPGLTHAPGLGLTRTSCRMSSVRIPMPCSTTHPPARSVLSRKHPLDVEHSPFTQEVGAHTLASSNVIRRSISTAYRAGRAQTEVETL
jgi:hypothetical protein